MNLRYTLIAAITLAACACGNTASSSKPSAISTTAASQWIRTTSEKPGILDVRTKEEFSEGHIAGAKLIPWTDSDFEARATKELDPSKPLLVYCRSGKRSSAAAEKLAALGFKDARNLTGGILAWKKEDLPLTQSR